MQSYTVTCIEKLPSGNWRVRTEVGRPFVLVERMGRWKTPCVIWMRDPHPGRTVTVKIPDWYAMRRAQLVGEELYRANLRRERDLARRKTTDADPQLWDRRFRTSRGSHSTAELTLAKFGPSGEDMNGKAAGERGDAQASPANDAPDSDLGGCAGEGGLEGTKAAPEASGRPGATSGS
jgi:hypothetical protein